MELEQRVSQSLEAVGASAYQQVSSAMQLYVLGSSAFASICPQ